MQIAIEKHKYNEEVLLKNAKLSCKLTRYHSALYRASTL